MTMSFMRDQKVGVRPNPPNINEPMQGGPITTSGPTPAYRYSARRSPARSRLEKLGFWVVVVAALLVLLVLVGFILPPIVGGLVAGFYTSLFVGALTLMNLARPSGWANSILGRRVFPVLRADDAEVWKLAGVNAALVFVFTFFFQLLATFLGGFLAGLVVFGGLIALGIFYNRARKVVIKP